jgi:hypothetical protein
MHPILHDSHKTPAHTMCEQFWRGTGQPPPFLVGERPLGQRPEAAHVVWTAAEPAYRIF